MTMRMRLNLLYKDGTNHELRLAIPPEVGNEISKKGLVATQVFIDELIQVPVPGSLRDNAILEDFKKDKP